MKKVGLCLLILFIGIGCSEDGENTDAPMENENNGNPVATAELVAIPDAAFEQALIDLNFDNTLDGEVDKNRIDFITELIIDNKGITDLTGINEFDALESLNIRNNEIESLNLTSNPALLFIWAEDNALSSINVDGLSSLEKLGLDRNVLEQINVRSNTALQLLTVSENQLSAIDVSNNNALTDFTVVDNPLNCILVNQSQQDAIPTDWSKDDEDSYALDCQ